LYYNRKNYSPDFENALKSLKSEWEKDDRLDEIRSELNEKSEKIKKNHKRLSISIGIFWVWALCALLFGYVFYGNFDSKTDLYIFSILVFPSLVVVSAGIVALQASSKSSSSMEYSGYSSSSSSSNNAAYDSQANSCGRYQNQDSTNDFPEGRIGYGSGSFDPSPFSNKDYHHMIGDHRGEIRDNGILGQDVYDNSENKVGNIRNGWLGCNPVVQDNKGNDVGEVTKDFFGNTIIKKK